MGEDMNFTDDLLSDAERIAYELSMLQQKEEQLKQALVQNGGTFCIKIGDLRKKFASIALRSQYADIQISCKYDTNLGIVYMSNRFAEKADNEYLCAFAVEDCICGFGDKVYLNPDDEIMTTYANAVDAFGPEKQAIADAVLGLIKEGKALVISNHNFEEVPPEDGNPAL